MPRLKLTAAAVERLKPPKAGQVDYFDSTLPGFAIRVTAKGVKSFVAFNRVNGRLRRVTLGRWPALTLAKARERAGAATDAAALGRDVTAEKRTAREAGADTVAGVVAEWLKRDQAKNRTAAEVERMLDKDVLQKWKHRRVESIGRRDVIELLDGIADRGAVTLARRVHAHLHRLFRWSVARGILPASPMEGLPKVGREVKRDRVLTDAELALVWRAADRIKAPFGPAVKVLILTGARRSEIGRLKWSEFDADAAAIRLEGDRTKTGDARTIPLPDAAVEIIADLPRIGDDKGNVIYAFTTTGETPVSGWSRAKDVLDREIDGLQRQDGKKAGHRGKLDDFPAWRIHDLRRTLATGLQRLGFKLEVIEAVLGHVSGSRGGIVGVYQRHGFEAEARAALAAWADHVAKIVGDKPAKVVKLRRKRPA